ncbi:carboxypeptidase-like regulatory domain-containing protein [Niabella hibiscisoli]|uniref:carboxypeptidase-like regulatory domain-containing protein n=1 Tax=Niabella hibiscisoli TaxID=1825928 RepID=UPI001F0FEB2A|nr:carboxypeptidase-like regulatory domain-containing protein [Niabella hibiscisoli]MCH5720718.1 carboxypeptidase-like regulatory domain-containing protein [Niabella hibiscisoli]
MPATLGDSIRPASADHTASVVKEKAETDQVIAAENKETDGVKPGLKKEQAISAKVSAPAPTQALQAPIAQKVMEDEATAPHKNESNFELKALKRKEVSDNYVSSMIAAPAPPAAPTPNIKTSGFGNATSLQPVAYIEGLVVDKDGAPLANASISVPGRNKTTANNDGSFVLPVYDSSFGVSVNRFGYQNATALLSPGKTNKIVLNKTPVNLDEIVVAGDNVKHRMKKAAFLEDARKAQALAVSANEVIYPEEGWSHFYEELGTSLGVDKGKKTKTLQIKFTVDDNGDPVDFEVVESPDAIMAKKRSSLLKKLNGKTSSSIKMPW